MLLSRIENVITKKNHPLHLNKIKFLFVQSNTIPFIILKIESSRKWHFQIHVKKNQ